MMSFNFKDFDPLSLLCHHYILENNIILTSIKDLLPKMKINFVSHHLIVAPLPLLNDVISGPSLIEIMAQSYIGRLEQKNKDLKQQLSNAKEEISSYLKALKILKDQHNKQKQELLDKIQRLENKIEQLKRQQTQLTAQIEVKKTKK